MLFCTGLIVAILASIYVPNELFKVSFCNGMFRMESGFRLWVLFPPGDSGSATGLWKLGVAVGLHAQFVHPSQNVLVRVRGFIQGVKPYPAGKVHDVGPR
jgi:hypothetical protein